MNKRGFALGKQRKDAYVNALMQYQVKGGAAAEQLLDKLLICALIEARSCERFRLLSEELEDDYLRDFYRRFMISEAGHYRLFIDLAREYLPEGQVTQRWQYWLQTEAAILREMEVRGDRMH